MNEAALFKIWVDAGYPLPLMAEGDDEMDNPKATNPYKHHAEHLRILAKQLEDEPDMFISVGHAIAFVARELLGFSLIELKECDGGET